MNHRLIGGLYRFLDINSIALIPRLTSNNRHEKCTVNTRNRGGRGEGLLCIKPHYGLLNFRLSPPMTETIQCSEKGVFKQENYDTAFSYAVYVSSPTITFEKWMKFINIQLYEPCKFIDEKRDSSLYIMGLCFSLYTPT
jgi:hypothetical protein